MSDFQNQYKRIALYAICIAICLYPVFATDLLVTLDGPTHVYNAAIYNRLLAGDSFTSTYLHINPEPVPNYLSHLLLSGLLYFMSSLSALKVLHTILIAGFLISFLYWNKRKTASYGLLIVLPLVISDLISNGFYNFEMGIILMLLTLRFYEQTKLQGWKQILILTLFLALVYFAHSLAFVMSGLILITLEIHRSIQQKSTPIVAAKKLAVLALAAAPCLLLSLFFMHARTPEYYFLSFSDLSKGLFNGFSLIGRSEAAQWVRMLFCCGLPILIVIRLIASGYRNTQSNYLLSAALLFLILYFILPDSVGYAGVFSIRFIYVFWVLLVAWIIRNPFSTEWVNMLPAGVALCLVFLQLQSQLKHWKEVDQDAALVMEAYESIPDKSVVYPVFASNPWLHFHLSNIGGADANLIILENNCARNSYFPVVYNAPYEELLKQQPLLNHPGIPGGIGYVLKIGANNPDSPTDRAILEEAMEKGQLISSNKLVEVWKL